MNNPVNYVDLWGLESTDGKAGNKITIQSGDTLSQRTAKYNKDNGTNFSWQEISDYNNLANPHVIHPGDVIYFPSVTPATAPDTGSTISVATPSNSVSSGNSSNGGGTGNASMGGGSSGSSFASVGMYNAEGTRGSQGPLQHTDLTGHNRVIAELKDCFGSSICDGLGTQFDINAFIAEAELGINLGSREITHDKYGKLIEDVISFNATVITEPEDIRVTIEDVYPGTKYEDTCIHYMIIYNDEVIPYEDSIDSFDK